VDVLAKIGEKGMKKVDWTISRHEKWWGLEIWRRTKGF
jgi:hypothetical protein